MSQKNQNNLKRLPKGIEFQEPEKDLQKEFSKTSLLVSIGVALSDWTLVFICMVLGTWLFSTFGISVVTVIVLLFFVFPVVAKAQRGMENLVHESSHYNFSRKHRSLNDMAGNWLCAYWLFLSVGNYRLTHIKHHAYFGSSDDPDKQRFETLNTDKMPRGNMIALVKYLFRVFPSYWIDYWKQFSGKSGQFALSAILQLTFVVIAGIFSPGFWLLWLVCWWIPFVVYLPFMRFFAESEKHHYKGVESEFDATYSNLGFFQKWFLHPHGDAYHLLHHMAPQVPHWRMAGLHRVLSIVNKRFNEGSVRTGVLESA